VETRAHADLEALGLDNWHEVEEAEMTSCDYNGWNDAPEEEREWFDCHPELSLCADPLDAQRLAGVALEHGPAAAMTKTHPAVLSRQGNVDTRCPR
jgi:hypothetical protein